jgi:homoserine O-succinyltransferase
MLTRKAFGLYRTRAVEPASPFLRGLLGRARRAREPLDRGAAAERRRPRGLRTLLPRTRWALPRRGRGAPALYIFNHLEYDSDTLKQEYDRDVRAGAPIELPRDYFPDERPLARPPNRWRSHAHLLYGNWINEIYQTTPYRAGCDRPLAPRPGLALALAGAGRGLARRPARGAAVALWPPRGASDHRAGRASML